MNIFMLAQAQDAAGAAGQEPANMFQQILASPMFMFVIIIVLFWVMLIRPQRKAQKEQQARIAALQRGDKVITNAGLHGFVEKVNERTVSLKIAEGVVIELIGKERDRSSGEVSFSAFRTFPASARVARRQGRMFIFETVFFRRG